uniref:Uncharacterized protein n=1 Tax=Rhizophora mucronata TaxID=61149 RepID=A0A2P2QGM6_RHIMU
MSISNNLLQLHEGVVFGFVLFMIKNNQVGLSTTGKGVGLPHANLLYI